MSGELSRQSSRELTPVERARYAARALDREIAALRASLNWLWCLAAINTASILLVSGKVAHVW